MIESDSLSEDEIPSDFGFKRRLSSYYYEQTQQQTTSRQFNGKLKPLVESSVYNKTPSKKQKKHPQQQHSQPLIKKQPQQQQQLQCIPTKSLQSTPNKQHETRDKRFNEPKLQDGQDEPFRSQETSTSRQEKSHKKKSHKANKKSKSFRLTGPTSTVNDPSSARLLTPKKTDEITLSAEQRKEELWKDHKTRLHIYLFVARCIAYDACNIFKKTNVIPIPPKVTRNGFEKIRSDFVDYFQAGTDRVFGDKVYRLNMRYFVQFMCDPRIMRIVATNGISFLIMTEVYERYNKCFPLHVRKCMKLNKLENFYYTFLFQNIATEY